MHHRVCRYSFISAGRTVAGRARPRQEHLQLKQRQRGLDEAGYVESFLVLNALGGECLDDFDRLREDEGLAEMLGHEVAEKRVRSRPLDQRRRSGGESRSVFVLE